MVAIIFSEIGRELNKKFDKNLIRYLRKFTCHYETIAQAHMKIFAL